MSSLALLIEIEELVFDTLALRAHALRSALLHEGVVISEDVIQREHAGATVCMTLDALPAASGLDGVARDLVLRRAADEARVALDHAAASFDRASRDAVLRLAVEYPVGVVTRGARDSAQRLLEQADLDSCIRTIQSLDDVPLSDQHHVWSDAAARLHRSHIVALGPPRTLAGARMAGQYTVAVGRGLAGGAGDEALVSLTQVDASFLASLPVFHE